MNSNTLTNHQARPPDIRTSSVLETSSRLATLKLVSDELCRHKLRGETFRQERQTAAKMTSLEEYRRRWEGSRDWGRSDDGQGFPRRSAVSKHFQQSMLNSLDMLFYQAVRLRISRAGRDRKDVATSTECSEFRTIKLGLRLDLSDISTSGVPKSLNMRSISDIVEVDDMFRNGKATGHLLYASTTSK